MIVTLLSPSRSFVWLDIGSALTRRCARPTTQCADRAPGTYPEKRKVSGEFDPHALAMSTP